MAEKSRWDHANIPQKLGLVWRNRKKISQIIKDFPLSTITYKVVMYAPAERADTLPYFSFTPVFTLWGR
jgi:hypothetical protein